MQNYTQHIILYIFMFIGVLIYLEEKKEKNLFLIVILNSLK